MKAEGQPMLAFPSDRVQRGSALLEALISVLIFSVALLGLMGIQGQAIKQNLVAKLRNDASFLVNRVQADIQNDVANFATYAGTYDSATASGHAHGTVQRQWCDSAAFSLPVGRVVVATNAADGTVTITASWAPNAETAAISAANYRHQHVLVTRVNALDVAI